MGFIWVFFGLDFFSLRKGLSALEDLNPQLQAIAINSTIT